MKKKKVLIVENIKKMLHHLQKNLEQCGFETYTASTVAEARQLAEQNWGELDVALLDMQLDDPSHPRITGADIGIEFRNKMKSFPPESLIYSGMNEIDYYRLALKLGAAAYLLKEFDGIEVVIRHVKVLALRRSLSGENPKIVAEVARISVHSKTQSEAILRFCREVLTPEFEACLGAQFVILFTDEDGTRNCADNLELPGESATFYHTLQALAHGKGNLTEPFVLESAELEPPFDQKDADLYQKLNLAAFLPLTLSTDLRLSIGILPGGVGVATPADAKALCTVLAQYLRPTVLENVMNIWSQWTELRATRASTAKLCLAVGQEISDALESVDPEPLNDLANDLNDTGQYLAHLDNHSWQYESDPVSMKDVVTNIWQLVSESQDTAKVVVDLQGDCLANVQRGDLEIVVSRLLQWFVYRSNAMPLDVAPVVKIKCVALDEAATVSFEDCSHRLPKVLRDDMFAPFTQAISTPFASVKLPGSAVDQTPTRSNLNTGRYLPLYLAKMLVEGRYHGLLEDHSDQILDHSYGHRILMELPAVNKRL